MHVLVNLVSVACYLSPGLAMSRLITANTVRVDHSHRAQTLGQLNMPFFFQGAFLSMRFIFYLVLLSPTNLSSIVFTIIFHAVLYL